MINIQMISPRGRTVLGLDRIEDVQLVMDLSALVVT